MDIAITKPLKKNSYAILREAGYIPIFDRASGKQSYIFRIRGDRYPRFHIYVTEESTAKVAWHLHLDHREHGWGEKLHDTEYNGNAVTEEGNRLRRWLAYFTDTSQPSEPTKPESKGLFSKWFGS